MTSCGKWVLGHVLSNELARLPVKGAAPPPRCALHSLVAWYRTCTVHTAQLVASNSTHCTLCSLPVGTNSTMPAQWARPQAASMDAHAHETQGRKPPFNPYCFKSTWRGVANGHMAGGGPLKGVCHRCTSCVVLVLLYIRRYHAAGHCWLAIASACYLSPNSLHPKSTLYLTATTTKGAASQPRV
jgi:hypothetical protein